MTPCRFDAVECIGCGECDDAGSFADESESFGCCFPGECCMPGPHFKSECFTAEMAEEMLRAAETESV